MKVIIENRSLMLSKTVFIIASTLILLLMPWHLWFSSSVSLADMNKPISFSHLLGTDALGRDQFVRLTAGMYQTIPLLWLYVSIGTLLGLSLGLGRILLGVRRSRFRLKAILQIIDGLMVVLTSIPITVLSFLTIVFFEANGFQTLLILLLIFVSIRCYLWIHQTFLTSSELGYWQAHEAIGGKLFDRLFCYGLSREWLRALTEMSIFHLKAAIIIEVSLSYLGFGVQEPSPSIGNMLSMQMERYMAGDIKFLLACLFAIWITCSFPKALFDMLFIVRQKFKASYSFEILPTKMS